MGYDRVQETMEKYPVLGKLFEEVLDQNYEKNKLPDESREAYKIRIMSGIQEKTDSEFEVEKVMKHDKFKDLPEEAKKEIVGKVLQAMENGKNRKELTLNHYSDMFAGKVQVLVTNGKTRGFDIDTSVQTSVREIEEYIQKFGHYRLTKDFSDRDKPPIYTQLVQISNQLQYVSTAIRHSECVDEVLMQLDGEEREQALKKLLDNSSYYAKMGGYACAAFGALQQIIQALEDKPELLSPKAIVFTKDDEEMPLTVQQQRIIRQNILENRWHLPDEICEPVLTLIASAKVLSNLKPRPIKVFNNFSTDLLPTLICEEICCTLDAVINAFGTASEEAANSGHVVKVFVHATRYFSLIKSLPNMNKAVRESNEFDL